METWDHSTHQQFYDYYAKASASDQTLRRFAAIRDNILRIIGRGNDPLEIADIGCGGGTQSLMWAELGHRVHALDINERLLQLARDRAAMAGYVIDFRLGSATELPWANNCVDVCLVPEVLEHVAEWRRCLDEFTRILRPGGILFLTTTNKLCPLQQEFNLPLYSWYPSQIKRYFENLALTTRPQLANYAKYPAVNWFSFYDLRDVLLNRRLRCLDKFDVMDLSNKHFAKKIAVLFIRHVPLFRWLAHVATPGTMLVGVKEGSQPRID